MRRAVILMLTVLMTLPMATGAVLAVEPGGTTVHEIVANPGAYDGQTVMLAGAVECPCTGGAK